MSKVKTSRSEGLRELLINMAIGALIGYGLCLTLHHIEPKENQWFYYLDWAGIMVAVIIAVWTVGLAVWIPIVLIFRKITKSEEPLFGED